MLNNYLRRKFRTKNNILLNNKNNRNRIVVSRSNKNIYIQLLDEKGGVIASSSSLILKANLSKKSGVEIAEEVGKDFTKKCIEKKVSKVVFDKGAYAYNGRIKAIADSCRKAGLEF
jgi:large subunit ribosomal protein L18